MSDLFDNISDWLMAQALSDASIIDTFQGLATRLLDGGVPVARVGMGRSVLHPVIGLIDILWTQDAKRVDMQTVARKDIGLDFLSGSPFGDVVSGKINKLVADLRDPEMVARYKIFERLAGDGLTSYLAFARQFGRRASSIEQVAERLRGASVSFATRRFSGFTPDEIDGLERLVTPLCICTRIDNDRFLAEEILETYLGRISGKQVLSGMVSRGDGRSIDCAIFYSDLRNSVGLSQQLDTQAYLDTLNAYFDCVATAVSEHGGEVLKFVGDGVLAIFPFDDTSRPRGNMCAAALHSAQEAFARAEFANKARIAEGLPAVDFGVALHVGDVIYGNVGTHDRLDFTATGSAVGMAARVEGLTRTLDAPILATKSFADLCAAPSKSLAPQAIRGFDDPVNVVSFDV